MSHWFEDWRVEITRRPGTMMKEIWIYRSLHDGKTEVLQADFKTVDTYDHGAVSNDAKPTLLIQEDLLAVIAEALRGIAPIEKKFTEGKLEATEYHLEDLRQMLKLKTAVEIKGMPINPNNQ